MVSPDKFYASARPLFGTITEAQVERIEAKLAVFAAAASPLACVAHRLATWLPETGAKMQPVTEIGCGRDKPYGVPGKYGGQVPYGRGDVRLTWDGNYEKADDELGLNGPLLADFNLALDTKMSACIMVRG